jgi:hypothetical protein
MSTVLPTKASHSLEEGVIGSAATTTQPGNRYARRSMSATSLL